MFVSLLRLYCEKVDLIVKLVGYATSILMPILAFVVSFEVFSRYFLNRPTIWAFDLSLFLFGYIAILGGALAHQKKGHITVDILYKKVSKKTRCVFDLISFSLGIFFLVLIVYICFDKFQDAINFGTRRQSEWAPLMHHFWLMTMFACSLFILQLARDMISNIFYLVTGEQLVEEKGLKLSCKKAEKNNGN